jgi:hypothetical protein
MKFHRERTDATEQMLAPPKAQNKLLTAILLIFAGAII